MWYRRYTWLPDLPDFRDHQYGARLPEQLPPAVDLRAKCSPVEDQGDIGSCTANAIAGALEFLEDKDGVKFNDMSRLFIYYNERAIEHDVRKDAGAMIRDGVKSLHTIGVCDEKLWPYDVKQFAHKPPAAAFADAAVRKITEYSRITSLASMKTCLADGFPFVFGFTVYDAFESAAVARTGFLNMPTPGEKSVGGHAVLCVGYDDASQRVIVRNSWGASWGQKGYFTMPYAYISNTNLADDMWTIRRGAGI